jgi:hypothetical protein
VCPHAGNAGKTSRSYEQLMCLKRNLVATHFEIRHNAGRGFRSKRAFFRSLLVYARKGRIRSSQIVVRASGSGLANVNVTVSHLTSGAGQW